MSLKVIAGAFRGRNLQSVKGIGTRPLLGQVREALFNILGERIVDARVWDLFAGTGANGIEALSRGADHCTFVEKAAKPIRILEENLEMLGEDVDGRYQVLRGDAWTPPMLDGHSDEEGHDEALPEEGADVIFLDPPYPQVSEDPVRSVYRATRLVSALSPEGILCFHFRNGVLQEDDFDQDLEVEIRTWGQSSIALIQSAAVSEQA